MTPSPRGPGRRSAARRRLLGPAILALAFALRAWLLGAKALWWDEALAVWALRKPLTGLTAWTAGDVHPPLFFWLHWFWRLTTGESPFALRFPSLLWGVLTVALAVALGRRAAGPAAGAWSGLLVGVAPFAVWWSQELRMYALAGLWVALLTYAAWRWAAGVGGETEGTAQWTGIPRRRAGSPAWLIAYGLAGVGLLYSLYLGAAALLAVNLAVGLHGLRRRPTRGQILAWSTAQVGILLAFLPWWRYAAARMQSWSSIRHPASPLEVLELGGSLLASGRSVELARGLPATLLFWSGAFLASLVAYRQGGLGRRAGFLWAPALLPWLAIWAATQPRSLFYSPGLEARYFYAFAVFVWVLVGASLAAARRAGRGPATLAAAALLAPLLGSLPSQVGPRRLRDELQSLSLALWSQARPDDALLLVSGDRYPLLETAYGAVRSPDLPPVLPFPGRAAGPLPADWQARLDRATAGHARIWLVELERHWQDPEGRIGDHLAGRHALAFGAEYGEARLRLFSAPSAAPLKVERVDVAWPGCRAWSGAQVERPAWDARQAGESSVLACLPATDLRPGDPLTLSLLERAPQRPALELRPLGGAGGIALARWPAEDAAAAGWTLRQARLQASERWPSGRYAFFLGDDPTPLSPGLEVRSPGLQPAPAAGAWQPLDLRFGTGQDALRLTGIALRGWPPRAGSSLTVDLRWDLPPEGPAPGPWPTVFVHALGPPRPDGSPLWAGSDGAPAGGAWPQAGGPLLDRHLLAIPDDAPPGPYQLELGLYNPAGAERWPVSGPGSDPQNRRALWPSNP